MYKYSFILIILSYISSLLFFGCTKEPSADFTSDNTTVFAYQNVIFTDLSGNKPASWNWSFNNGTPTTSVDQNPTAYWDKSGKYDVTLIAKNNKGLNTIIKQGYVTVKPSLVFWSSTSSNIDVYISHSPLDSLNYLTAYEAKGQITTTTSQAPDCGSNQGLQFNEKGNVYYFANVNNYHVKGNINITPATCNNQPIN